MSSVGLLKSLSTFSANHHYHDQQQQQHCLWSYKPVELRQLVLQHKGRQQQAACLWSYKPVVQTGAQFDDGLLSVAPVTRRTRPHLGPWHFVQVQVVRGHFNE
jgi:hypothetical protein